MNNPELQETILEIIDNAFIEDIREGDHTTLATIDADAVGKAILLVKEGGIIAGVELAQIILHHINPELEVEEFIPDGSEVEPGNIVFKVAGRVQALLVAERTMLNFMQRMSGISTKTHRFCQAIKHTHARILDTRKTTPGLRYFEKWAVRLGGGQNHRFGLYDMIMIKDNHIDFCGGIQKAIEKTKNYLEENELELKIEVETRNLKEVEEVLKTGGVDRIMLDNYSLEEMRKAVQLINSKVETEASGGVTLQTVAAIAETGVDYISVGELTHSINSLDLSFKAQLH
ncbi:MAG: carboxylating nicotinate-nucleotide diphosphorylase [Chitinophagales bacterium]